MTLRITEIFYSYCGVGIPCTFIRLAGCNLRCEWCDTKGSWETGTEMSVDDIIKQVDKDTVTITGGEPLIQDIRELVQKLDNGFGTDVIVETNGTIEPPRNVDGHVDIWSVSPKLTDDYEMAFKWRSNAYYKFVVMKKEDLKIIEEKYWNPNKKNIDNIIIQPDGNRTDYVKAIKELAEWNIGYDWRIIPQLHRICGWR